MVKLLELHPGAATNRTVVTFVGTPQAVIDAAFNAIVKAGELIDMSKQTGEHARMGATDVCPLIPVANISMEETSEWAIKLAKRVGENTHIPTYLYGASQPNTKRNVLATIRGGEYEGFFTKIKEPEWLIDQILERNTIGSIFGSPKSGKSLISLSMMMAISNGTEWFGHSVKQTPVVLFCGEGERSMHKRILAWAKFNEQTVRDNPFRMSNRPARILDDEDFALIMQTLKNT